MKGTLTLQPSGRMIDSNTSVYAMETKNKAVTTLGADGKPRTRHGMRKVVWVLPS